MPTRPPFPALGRILRPHLRKNSPARPSACRRVHPPRHRQHPSSRICGKPAPHAPPRADASAIPVIASIPPAAFAAKHPPTSFHMPTWLQSPSSPAFPPAAFAENQPCTLFRMPTRPPFPALGRILPAAFAEKQPRTPLHMPTRPPSPPSTAFPTAAFAEKHPPTSLHVPTRPSFPALGRILRPHLRKNSPARPSACRRVRHPRHRQHPPSRICGKTPSHLTPRADAALFIRKRTDFPAASAFRIASTVLFPQMRPRKKKILASAVKNPPGGILSGPIFSFSVNYRQTIHIQSFPVLPRKIIQPKKKRRKNKMHAFFLFSSSRKSPASAKRPEYQSVNMQ